MHFLLHTRMFLLYIVLQIRADDGIPASYKISTRQVLVVCRELVHAHMGQPHLCLFRPLELIPYFLCTIKSTGQKPSAISYQLIAFLSLSQ